MTPASSRRAPPRPGCNNHMPQRRAGPEDAGLSHVVAVPTSQQVHGPRIDHLIAQAPPEAWQPLSCGDGAKKERRYACAARPPAVREFDGEIPTRQRWMPARRSTTRPDEIASYLASAPPDATAREPGPHRGMPLKDRGVLPGREQRVRPAPVRTPPPRRLEPAHHTRHARAHLPRRDGCPGTRKRGGDAADTPDLVDLTPAETRRPPAVEPHRRPPRRPPRREHTVRFSHSRRRHPARARHCRHMRHGHTFAGRSATTAPHPPDPRHTPPPKPLTSSNEEVRREYQARPGDSGGCVPPGRESCGTTNATARVSRPRPPRAPAGAHSRPVRSCRSEAAGRRPKASRARR